MNIKNTIFLYFVFIPLVLYCQNASPQYSLEEIINIALKNSPEFETTKIELQQAELSYNEQISFIYPQMNLNFRLPVNINKSEQEVYNSGLDRYQLISRLDKSVNPGLSLNSNQHLFNDAKLKLNISGLNSRWDSDLLDEGNRFSGSADLVYDQRLFSFNNYSLKKKEADIHLQKSQINFKLQKNEFIYQIIEKYYELLVNLKKNEINKALIRDKEFQHNHIVELFKSGRKTELDTLNSSVRFKDAEINILRAKENLNKSKSNLLQRAGLKAEKSFNLDEQIIFVPFELNISEVIDLCVTNHPDIQSDNLSVKQNQLTLDKLNDELGMALNFSTSLSYRNTQDYLPRTSENQFYDWGVNLNLSLPIFDGGKSSAQIQNSKLSIKKQNILLNEKREKLKNDVKDLYQQLSIKRKEIDILYDKYNASSRALELANEKFKNGNLTSYQLSESESIFHNSEIEKLQTIIDYNKIVYQIKKYAGMELLP